MRGDALLGTLVPLERQQQIGVRDDVRRRLGGLLRRLAPQLGLAPQLRARALPRSRRLVRAAAPLIDVDFINAPVWKSKFYGAFVLNRRVPPHTRRTG